MKKIILSAAVAAMALSTSAFAADKGIDIVTTGQAVVYYETGTNNGAGEQPDLFSQDGSVANVGVQLNLDADLKNGFTFGSQLSYLGTAGLEKNLVNKPKQVAGATPGQGSTTDELALTKIFVAKTIANTTAKVGRMELPKSLSPFAYSEGWNVFKNTFDAALLINSDIPDTLVVGAYVSGGTDMTLGSTGNLEAVNDTAGGNTAGIPIEGSAYMLTVQNKSIPMTTLTGSYYDLNKIDTLQTVGDGKTGAAAMWLDAKVAGKDMPLGLKIGLQGGMITPENSGLDDTTAMGAKASIKVIDALTLALAYTMVDGNDNKGNVAIKNTGTGIKSPLYTQMVYNQDAISLDADTYMLKAAYNTGDYGTVIAQYAGTSAGNSNLMGAKADYAEFDLMYKLKAGGVSYFAAYINRSLDDPAAVAGDGDSEDKIRFWARLAF